MKQFKSFIVIILCFTVCLSQTYPASFLAPPGSRGMVIPSKKKLLIVDIGNVCLFFDWGKAVSQLQEYCDKDKSAILDVLVNSDLRKEHERGTITVEEYYRQCKKSLNFNRELTFDKFSEICTSIFQPNLPVMALMNYLMDKNQNVAILSDGAEIHRQYHTANHQLIKRISDKGKYYISSRIHTTKNSPQTFKHVLEQESVPAEEAVFIDDIEDYTFLAGREGIASIHFKGDIDELIDQLVQMGIPIDREELTSYTFAFIQSTIEECTPQGFKELPDEILRLLEGPHVLYGLYGLFVLASKDYWKGLDVLAGVYEYIHNMPSDKEYLDTIRRQCSQIPPIFKDIIFLFCSRFTAVNTGSFIKYLGDMFGSSSVPFLTYILNILSLEPKHEETLAYVIAFLNQNPKNRRSFTKDLSKMAEARTLIKKVTTHSLFYGIKARPRSIAGEILTQFTVISQ